MNRKKKQTKNKYTNNEERKIPSSSEIYRSLYNNGSILLFFGKRILGKFSNFLWMIYTLK